MITIENLRKSYGKLQVLKDINVSFEAGKVISVIGPNGSGKTTMSKCILGMALPDSGDIKINGESILKKHAYRSQIGYMPQIGKYPENMKIRQVIEMIRDIRKDVTTVDEELIGLYRLQEMYDKRMGSLSGGTKQKVSAALAFMFDPKILILDEPTAGLDPISAEILKCKILKEKKRGKLILITSHIMSEIEEVADEVMCLVDGNVKFHDTITDIKAQANEARLSKAIAKIMNGED
ncbi:ABC transporter ATP-binding protein [Pontibacter sp. BT310]|jgi:Cu-processing system ATP-binding protein|uniref:ABC transporter ATP-binding protein n=1 Tax=Pontibacter populi TaxID=890055 RepID=A0ABS6XCF4_9BACT|nr:MULTISPECIES: ABC transporter ATP-binding protein [Pontibacter]MBJ6118325.1 ABC transporter ATP-binding protein [Pontibacter sp. BT310]MBR0570752.1 ABC transporter ATP-binding protein [Microvirga sp. STS03]MBW3365178.1 ABC transporter ATP-binding protein [Pontibacter populi]